MVGTRNFVLTGLGASLLAGAAAWSATAVPDAPHNPRTLPPAALVNPVTETLWGRQVTDNYRYMETLDPATIAWMKAQGRYTRSVLDAIPPLPQLRTAVSSLSASFGLIQGYAQYGGRAFFEQRSPGSDNFDLVVSDAAGVRKIVDVAALRKSHGGRPYALSYFLASPDGGKVAVGIAQGGSENAALTVYDASSGRQIAGPIDRARFGATAWSQDSKILYFIRLKKLAAVDPPTETYMDATAQAWDLKSQPHAILGAGIGHGPPIKPVEFPALVMSAGAPLAAAMSINGVQTELAVWLAPVAEVRDPKTAWTQFVTREDGITAFDMRGAEIFLLSHQDAPTFKVLSVRAGQSLDRASLLVAAQADRVIEAIHAAADALYILARHGAYSQLLRIPAGATSIEEVPLPFEGHIDEAFSDPRASGITVGLSSWVVPPALYAYRPENKSFADLRIGTRGDFDSSNYVVSEVSARAGDGVLVPLSLIRPRDASGEGIAIIEAYGSYGISQLADFSVRRAAAMRQGITYGICHVRGGGDLGEAWRLSGKDANKHNTWGDLIACGEYAIAHGATSKPKLFILGGSAGGITVGRAITERPDLFAGAIDLVPASNTLRDEFSANGPPNIPEFGSITTEAGFNNLYEMDTLRHVNVGTQYPALLVTTGLNDPRVSPWEPAQTAAAFQASGTSRPVLLRIDEEAGHGIGSTKAQTDALTADWIGFVLWQAGLPQWQPQG